MTELKLFLASLCNSFAAAEIQALQYSQTRMVELLGSEAIPEDAQLPVYHATDITVDVEVGLETEQTDDGLKMYVTDTTPENATTLSFSVELYDLIDRTDLQDLNYDVILPELDLPQTIPAGDPYTAIDQILAGTDEQLAVGEHTVEQDEPEENNHTQVESEPENSTPVEVVQGIDTAYVARLQQNGITTISDLMDYSPDDLATTVSGEQVDVSTEQTSDWIDEARGLNAVLAESDADRPVELVDGIGSTYGSRLRAEGVEELSDLIRYDAEEIAQLVSTESTSVSTDRTADWLRQAELQLEILETTTNSNTDTRGDSD